MVFLDNGASSFPKAPGVAEAISDYINRLGVNMNRSSYEAATETALLAADLRERLCLFFGSSYEEGCIFTPGATFGLNQVINGIIDKGDHVIVSSLEHNAVMRPLAALKDQGVSFDRIPSSPDGTIDPNDAKKLIKPNTKMFLVSHASNVNGVILPIEDLGKIASDHGIFFAVDAAQSAGHLQIDMDAIKIDALVFPGHKGLLGPQGIGIMMVNKEAGQRLKPLIRGGTGSRSDSEEQPSELPDKFEAGTLNLPGIVGLSAALSFLEKRNITSMHEHEMRLCGRFLDGLKELSQVREIGPEDLNNRVAVASLDFIGRDNAEVAYFLESTYKILTRTGLHCAPNAHRTLGTYPQGSVRFSFGWANSDEDVDAALEGIRAAVN